MTSLQPPSVDEPGPLPRPATPSPAAGPTGAAAWPPWAALAALFAAFFCVTVVATVVAAASGSTSELRDPSPGVNLALTFFQDFVFVGVAVGVAYLIGRPRAADFGLVAPAQRGRAIGLLVAVWVSFLVVSAVWVTALGLHEKQELPGRLGADGSTLSAIAVIVLITVFAPLGEEMLFRGLVFGSLRNWRGVWPAAIITGILFGGIHAGSAPVGFLVPLGFLGFGLCLLYHFTGSLYPGIALHALNNSIALGSTLHYDWQIPVMMVGSVIVALAIAARLGRLLGGGRA
ncbi:MAG: protease family protein, partial [Solirubrobacteraceae bacterium]|nr:protease family protein [Solirubrobacteraceae bacterium]